MRVRSRCRSAPRRGASIIELLVAMVLGAILAAGAMRLLDRTVRFVEGSVLVTESASQLDAAAVALRSALEGASIAGGDLRSGTDSSFILAGAIGHAIACRVTRATVMAPPDALASRLPLTAWESAPQAGDLAVTLDEGAQAGGGDDRWIVASVASIAAVPNGCAGTPYVDPVADAGKAAWRITLADTLPPTVRPGAPLRVLRPQRYALYRSAGQWTLGWADTNAVTGGWNGIQPLAGPLEPYAPTSGGLSLDWLDSTGAVLGLPVFPGAAPASVRLAIRARTAAALRMDGRRRGVHIDSLRIRVPARNWR